MVKDTFKWLDQFDDHIIVTDENAIITHANAATETATGYPRNKIIGKKAGVLWGGHMSQDFYEQMWQVIKQDKRSFVGIVRNQKKNGEYYYAELRVYPVVDRRGVLKHFIGIEPDVTDRVVKQTLQENFVSLIKHELRNAVGAAKLMLEVLKQEDLTKEQWKIVSSIGKENDRIQNTIDTLSLIGTAKLTSVDTAEKISFKEAIENTVTRLKNRNGVTFEKNIASASELVGPRNIVEHVIENVISNAVKYSPTGGQVQVRLQKAGSGVRFVCEDKGIGIPKHDQQLLFDPFFRASNAKFAKGTGLGLFVTKELLDKIGGSITVRSKVGRGTRVTVFFPTDLY